ncbi:MAG: AbrB/MazE/SpoVT family DNA-binding domain-containing protein [Candidatus Nitrosotenuis sp.]
MKSEKRTVGERGQIVLPKKLRERFNLRPGKKVIVEERADSIILKPDQDPKAFVEEFVSVPRKVKKLGISDIKKVLEEEYEIH